MFAFLDEKGKQCNAVECYLKDLLLTLDYWKRYEELSDDSQL